MCGPIMCRRLLAGTGRCLRSLVAQVVTVICGSGPLVLTGDDSAHVMEL